MGRVSVHRLDVLHLPQAWERCDGSRERYSLAPPQLALRTSPPIPSLDEPPDQSPQPTTDPTAGHWSQSARRTPLGDAPASGPWSPRISGAPGGQATADRFDAPTPPGASGRAHRSPPSGPRPTSLQLGRPSPERPCVHLRIAGQMNGKVHAAEAISPTAPDLTVPQPLRYRGLRKGRSPSPDSDRSASWDSGRDRPLNIEHMP
jgi:hypothetical protein